MPGSPTWRGQADGVLLRRPQRLVGNRLLDAEPVLARRAVPRPVQPRMIAEDLQPRPDDEDQQEQVEEVLHADPDRKAGTRLRAGRLDGARVADDEPLDRRHVAQTLRGRHGDDQDDEPDRQQPEQVEPPVAPDAHPRRDALHLGNRPRPRRRVDHVLALGQLRPEAPHRLRRDLRRCGRGHALTEPVANRQPLRIAIDDFRRRFTSEGAVGNGVLAVESSLGLGHQFDKIEQTARVATLVVVPTQCLDQPKPLMPTCTVMVRLRISLRLPQLVPAALR